MKRLATAVAVFALAALQPAAGAALLAAPANGVPDQAGWTAAKHFAELPGGQRIAYLDLGRREAPAILLLHGYTDSSRAWSLMAPGLAAGHRLIIPDLRGHGASGKPAQGYTYSAIGADVIGLADALGLARFDLVGHSMGSMIAQHLAAEQRERVRHVVLVASTVLQPIEQGSELLQGLTSLSDPLDPADPFIADWLLQTELMPPNPAFTDRVKEEALMLPAYAWRQLAENFSAGPVGADLGRIGAPVLLLSGGADPLFGPRHLAAFDEAFPGRPHCVMPGGGHNLPYEAPDWTLARIVPFLDDAPGDPCGAS